MFLHANGYPPACYRPLLEALASDYHSTAMVMRPLWPGARPEIVQSWSIFSEDLLKFITERGWPPVMIIGHSLGAMVALRAALTQPDRFAALVLIDPVLYPAPVMISWWLMRVLGLGYRFHPMIRGALNRRSAFSSREEMFQRYRGHPIFRRLSDQNLRACIEGLTEQRTDGSLRLVYPPAWEARVYYTAIWNDWDIWRRISNLAVPALIIRGQQSDTFWGSTAQAVIKRNPRMQVATIQSASHLVALEHPEAVADLSIHFFHHCRLRREPAAA